MNANDKFVQYMSSADTFIKEKLMKLKIKVYFIFDLLLRIIIENLF